jgi:hypothetical protein
MIMRISKRTVMLIMSSVTVTALSGGAFAFHNTTSHAAASNPYILSRKALRTVQPKFQAIGPQRPEAHKKQNVNLVNRCANGVLDTVTTFCGSYTVAGFDPNGNPNSQWYFNMVGNAPQQTGAGTTTFHAPIIPVLVQFLNADGAIAATSDPMPKLQATLNSPVFSNTKFSSSPKPTQFADAVQRAQFYHQAGPNWHTLLDPSVKAERTIKVPYGDYYLVLNPDGSCCLAYLVDFTIMVNLLFPPTFPIDTTTVIGAAELAGDMTTKDITTTFFNSVYMYSGPNPPSPANCCWSGFHDYDYEPGATSGALPRAYVSDFASWITPGFFGNAQGVLGDVFALSHEMAEIFNDPFGATLGSLDVTPWWLSGSLCQWNLEVGDAAEAVPNSSYPITMNGMTYHLQNVALLQWFESSGHSDALDGAFSYPNESLLTTSNVSQQPNCTDPA